MKYKKKKKNYSIRNLTADPKSQINVNVVHCFD